MKRRKKYQRKRLRRLPQEQKLNWDETRIRQQFQELAQAFKEASATQNVRDPLLHLADAINNAATAMRDLREKSTTLERLADLLHIANVGVK